MYFFLFCVFFWISSQEFLVDVTVPHVCIDLKGIKEILYKWWGTKQYQVYDQSYFAPPVIVLSGAGFVACSCLNVCIVQFCQV